MPKNRLVVFYLVSKKAEVLKIITDQIGDVKAFQVIKGSEEKLIGVINVYDENDVGKNSKLDKAVEIAGIIRNVGQFIFFQI